MSKGKYKLLSGFLMLILLCGSTTTFAKHILGGYVQYEYQGAGSSSGTSMYKITAYVYKSCTENGPLPSGLGIYDAVTNATVTTFSNIASQFSLSQTIYKTTYDPCLSNPPSICYQVYTYTTTVTLADNANGYLIATQDANRSAGIINITNSNSTGITFTATIPGTQNGVSYANNSSPNFIFKDTAIICYNTYFEYQFSATDADSLTYEFTDGLNGTQSLTSPPYSPLTYNSGYSGSNPFGTNVSINPTTGLIAGMAPTTTGTYVLAVNVVEWRNGIAFNRTKKELQINVTNCSITGASLKPSYINCNNFSFSFQNESTSSNITSYFWDFGVTYLTTDTSSSATPSYTYPDTGTFTLKLRITNSSGCKDSTFATVKVYPGFRVGFKVTGSCYQTPFVFVDTSYIRYGAVNGMLWDFGDMTTTNDTASVNPANYTYSAAGQYTASLHLTSTKGCDTTITKIVQVNNKPSLYLPFTDTLICSIDTLPLLVQVNANNNVLWSPNYNITNVNSTNPLVYPKDSTKYKVVVTESGCKDSAYVQVNVLKFIAVELGADLNLCKTDSITLQPTSHALSYSWTPTSSLNNAFIKYPKAGPMSTTKYYVQANLGKCEAKDSVTVFVAPYPIANAGPDTSICVGSKALLHGSLVGSYFHWTPTNTLTAATTLTPIAKPDTSTYYMLTVGDTSYCKKTVTDSMLLTVIIPAKLSVGADTTVVIYQPLQLQGITTATNYTYKWTPATYLNNDTLHNPVAIFTNGAPDYFKYVLTASTPEGCSTTDDIVVKIFKTAPDIFVPTAFTPNKDGKNDVLKPILVGIKQLKYFNVYNRLGQIVFTTKEPDKGWNGNVNGLPQNTGDVFVFMTEGVDYLGNTIFRKGTTVLIR